MKEFSLLLILMAGVLFSACENENMTVSNIDGEECMLPIKLNAIAQTGAKVGTRSLETLPDEGTGPDYVIKDFWLLQYDDKGILIGSPRYYKMESFANADAIVAVVVPQGELKYTCVVVANSHSDQLYSQMGDVTTLDKLARASKRVSSLESLYNVSGNDLMMNGVQEITSSTGQLSFDLYRNVAKVTIDLKNGAGSGVTIKSVQMKNIPQKLFYADRLNDGISPFPAGGDVEGIDFAVENCELNAGDNKKLVYYLPRNVQGVTGSSTPQSKNSTATELSNPTYLEILAETEGIPLRFRFYLGANITNDFNIKPNYHYTYPITINGAGDPATDSRVENLGKIELDGANCYIINPLSGTSQPLYRLVTSRANQFWSSQDGNNAEVLTESSEWVAEVIWQDASARILDFYDENGEIRKSGSKPADVYEGIGNNSFYFKPRQGAKGNVLVGIRPKNVTAGKEKESYWWSWHLWITDYDPTPVQPVVEGTYIYQSKSGGYVHHYADAHGMELWSNKYMAKVIMDRNLGALSATQGNTSENIDKAALSYQYGKKDPMPSTDIYDINGISIKFGEDNVKPIRVVAGPVELKTSVQAPYVFYSKDQTGGDWLPDNNPYKNYIWNNPDNWYPEGKNGKSFFDPCPKGWKIPENAVYGIFTKTKNPGQDENNSANVPSGDDWYFYISDIGKGDMAYYPKNVARHPYSGQVSYLGAIWTNASTANHLFFNLGTTKSAQWNRGSSKSWGYAVRCIQE